MIELLVFDSGSNEIAIKATKDGPVELYQNGYGAPDGLRFHTTGVGVSVVGMTSMTDNLMVGTGATVTTDGNAFYAGIVTATSFIGDGGGLTNVIGSGSGVIIKEGGTTVGTAGTINFVGVDVTDISAGVVTVSTATTSITDGNSKLFVNNVSSSNGNGSFEVFLNEFTSSGTSEALNMHQPSDVPEEVNSFKNTSNEPLPFDELTLLTNNLLLPSVIDVVAVETVTTPAEISVTSTPTKLIVPAVPTVVPPSLIITPEPEPITLVSPPPSPMNDVAVTIPA
jgi:hypothetical protein